MQNENTTNPIQPNLFPSEDTAIQPVKKATSKTVKKTVKKTADKSALTVEQIVNVPNFKNLIRKGIQINKSDAPLFDAIPDKTWEKIFITNFSGNYELASRFILNKFKEINTIDKKRVDLQKKKIHNLKPATDMLNDAINKGIPIIFITDFDNDGSLCQSVLNEYIQIDPVGSKNFHIEYAQSINGNTSRGLNIDHVSYLMDYYGYSDNQEVLIVTADNGINSREDQLKIEKKYKNSKLIITDHHNPEPDMVVTERAGRTIIFNPHYKPTEFYKKYNISGATTVGVLMENLLEARFTEQELNTVENKAHINNMHNLFKASNLVDYVYTDPADKPEKDYVISRFLELQPLLNVTNSITKLINYDLHPDTLDAIKQYVPLANIETIKNEEQNIKTQNILAKALIKTYEDYKLIPQELQPSISKINFYSIYAKNLADINNGDSKQYANTNFIEQLRPFIFSFTVNDNNDIFTEELNNAMKDIFTQLRQSEKTISNELRLGSLVTAESLEYSTILYAHPSILKSFTRKFLNKVYNNENSGFALTLDSIAPARVSGSFRSTYNISDILKNKAAIEKELNCRIETPGHERAAGFILTAIDPLNKPITDQTIRTLNFLVNEQLTAIVKKDKNAKEDFILTDLSTISIIDKINKIIRGNVSNQEHIKPILKIDENTVWSDPFTGNSITMDEIVDNKKFGYVSINTNFHGDTVIIPTELIRSIVKSGYTKYLSLGYMDEGVFIGDRIIDDKKINSIIDLRKDNYKTKAIHDTWTKHNFHKNPVYPLTREMIKDNPFYKYSDYGDLNFDLFERMVIGIIDANKIDILSILDVEAIGFGNAKIINIGYMNYEIDSNSGIKISKDEFKHKLFTNQKGENYLLKDDEIANLHEITYDQLYLITPEERGNLLVNSSSIIDFENPETKYFVTKITRDRDGKFSKKLPYTRVSNYKTDEKSNDIIYNRSIKAEMISHIIKDRDLKVPATMTSLTGIDQNVLNQYGVQTSDVDNQIDDYFNNQHKGKKVLFGAHNIPYDGRILKSNMPKSYKLLQDNLIYDSALFSKNNILAYDNIQVSYFDPSVVVGTTTGNSKIYFYNNPSSSYNLTTFIKNMEDGTYPDRTGNFLLEIDNGNFYMVDKVEHTKTKLIFDHNLIKNALSDASAILLESKNHNQLLDQFEKDTGTKYDYTPKEAKSLRKMERHINASEKTIKILDDENIDPSARMLLFSMRTNPIPGNSTKYSVEKLSEQYMIHSLLLCNESFHIEHVDLHSSPLYKAFLPYEQEMIYFQENYHFDLSIDENIESFTNTFETLPILIDVNKFFGDKEQLEKELLSNENYIDHIENNIDFFNPNTPNDASAKEYIQSITNDQISIKELLIALSIDFIKKNAKITEKFADAWIYKTVLEFYEPNPHSPSDSFRYNNADLIDLVHFHTAIPKDKIKSIFKEASEFKQKYNIDHIIQHESHVNGPIDGDIKGDIAFEDKLTLTLLANRSYNSYNHSVDTAVGIFNISSINASRDFKKSELFTELASDSYSYRQALTYDRDSQTDLINSVQQNENIINSSNKSNIVKFKLANNVLLDKTAIYGITHSSIALSREQIEIDSKMLSEIALNEQIKYSISRGILTSKKSSSAKAKAVNETDNKYKLEQYLTSEIFSKLPTESKSARGLSEIYLAILKENDKTSLEYKKDLSKRYKFIDFSRKQYYIQSILDKFEDHLSGEKILIETENPPFNVPDHVNEEDFAKIDEVIQSIVNNHIRLNTSQANTIKKRYQVLKDCYYPIIKSQLSDLIADRYIANFNFESELAEVNSDNQIQIQTGNFLPSLDILRKEPVTMLFEKFLKYKLLNEFIATSLKGDITYEASDSQKTLFKPM